jgi:anti-sigma regulatory factor (Ser/Thr protein kinase)
MKRDEPPMKTENSVTVQNQISELLRLNKFISDFWIENQLAPDIEFGVSLALEEAFTNVVRYGFEDVGEHQILVRLSLEDGWITLSVEDDGIPFNPLEVPPPDVNSPIEERAIGGLGIHLVKNVVDQLQYTRQGGRNRLVMKMKIGEGG